MNSTDWLILTGAYLIALAPLTAAIYLGTLWAHRTATKPRTPRGSWTGKPAPRQ